MKPTALLLAAATVLLSACTQTGPVELSLGGGAPPSGLASDNADFTGMDRTMDGCKQAAKNAGAGRCTQVRAYEACMKTKGYITVLGPENPPGCGQPAWEEDVRKWLQ